MDYRILSVAINTEYDIVDVRRRARHIAQLLGFSAQDQARIATAVSEIARNAYAYGGGGAAEFAVEAAPPSPSLWIRIRDGGKGIANLPAILAGGNRLSSGLGMGLIGAHRLMDSCDVETGAGRGTTVILRKILPAGVSIDNELLALIAVRLSASPSTDSVAEVQLQNKELLQTLAELRTRQDELLLLTRELEDTNRGVVALYAEIEEKANRLRRVGEMKSSFLSNTSHELRTPLGSIRALAQLLLSHADGDLTAEQEKQVRFIERTASELSDLVNDLLDTAKIEAGKIDIKISEVSINALFSTLRGMLRPLGMDQQVELVFEDTEPDVMLATDEGKVSQILRNFIANAFKFTRAGEVRVSARCSAQENIVRLSVSDTGIGIAAADMPLIFEEFGQVENPLQQYAKGTGLGLPLCRRLATLLGGALEVQSTPGTGSVFSLVLPLYRAGAGDTDAAHSRDGEGRREPANPAPSPHQIPAQGV